MLCIINHSNQFELAKIIFLISTAVGQIQLAQTQVSKQVSTTKRSPKCWTMLFIYTHSLHWKLAPCLSLMTSLPLSSLRSFVLWLLHCWPKRGWCQHPCYQSHRHPLLPPPPSPPPAAILIIGEALESLRFFKSPSGLIVSCRPSSCADLWQSIRYHVKRGFAQITP